MRSWRVVGDFRRGSLNAVRRRCGKANCACAREGHPGHGPQHNLTRWVGGKSVNVRVRPGPELDKVTREVAAWQRFQGLVEAVAVANEAICGVRPVAPAAADVAPGSSGEIRGLCSRFRPRLEAQFQAEITTEVTRLATLLAGQVAADTHGGQGGDGPEAVELAIRAAMLAVGGSLPGQLLATDPGHRGPRVDCGRSLPTGPRPATRCSARSRCGGSGTTVVSAGTAWHRRDEQLAVAGTSATPGLRTMIDRAGAAVPFAPAGRPLADLAGIDVNAKRVARTAEADGQGAATAIAARAAAITARTPGPATPSPLPDILYTAIDGTGVPMTAAETEDRPGKTDRPDRGGGRLPDDGRARTREVELACLFTQTTVDGDGYPVRDPGSCSYLASFAPAPEFGPLVGAEARRRGADHIRQLLVLGDGAGTGNSPASSCPPRPRSWTSTTPANTCTP
jgi:hypothetical protein